MISSRTPEGEPASCPICEQIVFAEPSLYFSDAPCPSCGSLLWFVRLGDQNLVVQPTDEARRKGLIHVLSELTGVGESELRDDPASLDCADLDSMDLVELVIKLEDEFSE